MTSKNKDEVNGFYFYLYMKDGKPFYKNLLSQNYLYLASNGFWYVSNEEDLEVNKAAGWCRSANSGLAHPSQALSWKGWKTKWVKQPAVKVVTMVSPRSKYEREVFFSTHWSSLLGEIIFQFF